MKNNSFLFLGIIGAAAIGAAIGIAYAPDKGSVTRKKLKKKARRSTEDMIDFLEEKKRKSTEKVNALTEKVNELVEASKEKVKELRHVQVS